MNSKIVIEVSDQDCVAYLKEFENGTSKYQVMEYLRRMGITRGVLDDKIAERLFNIADSNTPIAQTVDTSQAVKLYGTNSISFEQFLKEVEDSYSVIQSGSQNSDKPFIIYCEENKTVFTLDLFKEYTNLFNKPIFSPKLDTIVPYISDDFEVKESNGLLSFKSKKEGYVVLDADKNLTLISPFEVSEDKMQMTVNIYPLKFGFKELVKKSIKLKETYEKEVGILPVEIPELNLQKCPENYTQIVIRRGKKAIHGENAQITFKLESSPKAKSDVKDRVNLKEFNSFVEVKKDQILLIKRVVKPPIDGFNVLGEKLIAEPGSDIEIKINENIKETQLSDEIHYSSLLAGVYREKNHELSVSETLEIEGDAGVKTGNITYSKDIHIKGSVLNGYKVQCGKNLHIEKNIEDSVTIACEKNMVVQNGIFGENADITVNGDLEVGFIQDTNVTVQGNLLVHSSILNSNVTVMGEITVLGEHIDKDKTSVIGGNIITMRGIRAHSMGSFYSKTVINCGFNPKMHQNILEINELIKKLDIVLIKIQNSIGFNIRDKHNIKRLAYISENERKVVKDKLKKLKEVSDKRSSLLNTIEKIKKLTYAEDKDSLYVQVDNIISPDITIYLYHDIEKIKTELMSVRYYLKNGSIVKTDSQASKS